MTKRYNEPFYIAESGYRSLLSNLLQKRGFYNQEILFKWNKIVGSDLSNLYIPHSIKYVKSTKSKKQEINFDSVDGVMINQKANVNQKLNQILVLRPKNNKDFYKFTYYKADFLNKIEFFFGQKMFHDIVCNKD